MAVNYDAATKTARMAATILQIDGHASPATLEICTAAFAVTLVVITLSDPSFTESGGVITLAGVPKSAVAANTGTAAVARIKNGGGTVKVDNLSVGTSGSDINLDDIAVAGGETVTLTSGIITHAA